MDTTEVPAAKQAHPAFWPTYTAALTAILIARPETRLESDPKGIVNLIEEGGATEVRDSAVLAAMLVAENAVDTFEWLEEQDQ